MMLETIERTSGEVAEGRRDAIDARSRRECRLARRRYGQVSATSSLRPQGTQQ